MTALAQSIAQAIQAQEGYGTPNAVTINANNNPLALRSWPGYPTVNGFAQFPDYATGFAKGVTDVQTNIDAGLSLSQFISKYEGGPSNPDNNNITSYTSFVASRTGLDPNVPMGAAASMSPDSGTPFDPNAILADLGISTDSLQAGSIDWTTLGIVGLGLFALWYFAD